MPVTIQRGDQITVPAPYKVASGEGVLVGSMFGVAVNDAESTDLVDIVLTGVYDLKKVGSQGWAIGAPVYWDNSAKKCTTASGAGANLQIGLSVLVVGSTAGETIGRVRLNGSTAKPEPQG